MCRNQFNTSIKLRLYIPFILAYLNSKSGKKKLDMILSKLQREHGLLSDNTTTTGWNYEDSWSLIHNSIFPDQKLYTHWLIGSWIGILETWVNKWLEGGRYAERKNNHFGIMRNSSVQKFDSVVLSFQCGEKITTCSLFSHFLVSDEMSKDCLSIL